MQTRRVALDAMLEYFNNQAQPLADDVEITDDDVTTADGATLLARWYRRPAGGTGAAVLYLHGGGMIAGSVPVFDGPVSRYVARTGVPMLSVQYRLAPEHPHPVPVEDDNATGWNALLGAGHEKRDADPAAAPGRLTDARGLPPAYIEAGQLDVFRDESLRYALTLSQAGVPVELHLHPGVPHEYDAIAFDADVSRRAQADRGRVLRSL